MVIIYSLINNIIIYFDDGLVKSKIFFGIIFFRVVFFIINVLGLNCIWFIDVRIIGLDNSFIRFDVVVRFVVLEIGYILFFGSMYLLVVFLGFVSFWFLVLVLVFLVVGVICVIDNILLCINIVWWKWFKICGFYGKSFNYF